MDALQVGWAGLAAGAAGAGLAAAGLAAVLQAAALAWRLDPPPGPVPPTPRVDPRAVARRLGLASAALLLALVLLDIAVLRALPALDAWPSWRLPLLALALAVLQARPWSDRARAEDARDARPLADTALPRALAAVAALGGTVAIGAALPEALPIPDALAAALPAAGAAAALLAIGAPALLALLARLQLADLPAALRGVPALLLASALLALAAALAASVLAGGPGA